MKKNIIFLLLIALIVIVSCAEKADDEQPDVNVEVLQKDYMKWWIYYSERINLSSDFIAIDHSSNKITKGIFLNNLTTGKYIPVRLITKDTTKIYYKLIQLNQSTNNNIKEAIKNVALTENEHFKMEGQKFPGFSFTDLNGKLYTNENTLGKIVVLKCWFIRCHACVAEFPELNEIVNHYKNRNDIVFVSLAFDKEADLRTFLLTKTFNYATVSCPQSYLQDTLMVHAYPTHFIIDKNGIIVKVVNKAVRLNSVLANAMKADIQV